MFRDEQHIRRVINPIGFRRQCDGDRFLTDSMQHGEMVIRVEDAFLIGVKMYAGGLCGMA